ncbi:M56 family metallopeptidase [bacterium]|nr:M56 family metallopeptidase [bacterium]
MKRWPSIVTLAWPALLVLVGDLYAATHYRVSCLIAPQWSGKSLGLGVLLAANLLLLGSLVWQVVRLRAVSRRIHRLPRLEPSAYQRLALDGLDGVEVRVLEHDAPVLFTTDGLRPTIVVSRWMLQRLDEQELRAAFAHELAHLQHRDGLVMLLVHGLCPGGFGLGFFQQRLEWLAREFELRADAIAARRIGDPLAVASALVKVGRHAHPQAAAMAFAARPSALQTRVAALLADAPRPRDPHSWETPWLMLVGASSLAAWLVFVAHLCVRGLG